VHWYDAEDEVYYLQRTRHYDFNRPEDIQQFQMHTRNVVDWGISERLGKIRLALDVILAEEIKRKQWQGKRRGKPSSPPAS